MCVYVCVWDVTRIRIYCKSKEPCPILKTFHQNTISYTRTNLGEVKSFTHGPITTTKTKERRKNSFRSTFFFALPILKWWGFCRLYFSSSSNKLTEEFPFFYCPIDFILLLNRPLFVQKWYETIWIAKDKRGFSSSLSNVKGIIW